MIYSTCIEDLRPDVALNCRLFVELMTAAGFKVKIVNTVRDKEMQESLYKKGVTKARTPTFHSNIIGGGLAFDICQNVAGHAYDNPKFWDKAGEIGEKIGFEWAYRWKSFPEMPHFQWPGKEKLKGADILAGKRPSIMPLCKEETVNVENITVIMNGKPTIIPAILHEGHYYAQVRALAEAQTDDKLTVDWNGQVIVNSK